MEIFHFSSNKWALERQIFSFEGFTAFDINEKGKVSAIIINLKLHFLISTHGAALKRPQIYQKELQQINKFRYDFVCFKADGDLW
jgi:hypothetical protein